MRYSLKPSYEEEGLLGKGAFAEVYRVRLQGKLYALKRIYNYHLKDPNYYTSIKREIAIMQRLNHPNIVALVDVYETDNSLQLLLEYVPNGSLYDKMKEHDRLPESAVKGYAADIISAVKYLHEFPQPILHRDIKPQNILISQKNRAKLCDFGSANMIVPDHLRDSYVGTAQYMPPEMKECRPHNQSLDLWCIGVMIYQLLTGMVPDVEGGVDYPEYISRPVEDLLKRVLVREQAKRITLQEIEDHIWFAEPVQDPPISTFILQTTRLQCSTMLQRISSKQSTLKQKLLQKNQHPQYPQQPPTPITSSSQLNKLAEQTAHEYIKNLKLRSDLENQIREGEDVMGQERTKEELLGQLGDRVGGIYEGKVLRIRSRNQEIEKLEENQQQKCKKKLQNLVSKFTKLKQHASNIPESSKQRILEFKQTTVEPITMPVSEYLPKLHIKMLENRRNALIELKCVRKRKEEVAMLVHVEDDLAGDSGHLEISSANMLMRDNM